ncbi:hypothetical protein OEZ85_001172 [Tetradesmus obliquus]|uniref:FAD/NAD(P)-binding domain-containing protein n=1 Tax=Tetradesmus obliquus TaxID=3088 RepID=A0ABY8UP82_TETOB|nr:hypothetical protein OEZ85_001172 [Tetradesmus obliquus]
MSSRVLHANCNQQQAASAARHRCICNAASKDGYKVLVLGGGSGGSAVAAHYCRKLGKDQVAVIDPSEQHYYQPMFTLVGGGLRSLQDATQPEGQVLPQGVAWLRSAAAEIDADSSTVTTADGRRLRYEYLVVATGCQPKWDSVRGLPEALGDGRVVSNYSPKYAPLTFEALKDLKQGHAIFTMPKGTVKCPGAGHKVCWLSEDYLRRHGRRPAVKVTYVTPSARVLGLQRYLPTIERITQERDIAVVPSTHLVEVCGRQQEAVFDCLDASGTPTGQQRVMHYDLLHVTPPHVPAPAVANSSLADAGGWLAVDKETLQHLRYPNVFGIGDCCSLPTGKTAAAAAAQFLVLRDNLDALMAGSLQQDSAAKYDGYTSCPVVTRQGRVMLMEYGYDGVIMEMFSKLGIDQSQEQYLMWLVKTLVLPAAYWALMTKGYDARSILQLAP